MANKALIKFSDARLSDAKGWIDIVCFRQGPENCRQKNSWTRNAHPSDVTKSLYKMYSINEGKNKTKIIKICYTFQRYELFQGKIYNSQWALFHPICEHRGKSNA